MKFLCALRDLQRAMVLYENSFLNAYGISLNEGMLLCCLSDKQLKATELAESIELTCSNCSKVIKLAEDKGYIALKIGKEDKRQMLFTLTESGKQKIVEIETNTIALPEVLQDYIKCYENKPNLN